MGTSSSDSQLRAETEAEIRERAGAGVPDCGDGRSPARLLFACRTLVVSAELQVQAIVNGPALVPELPGPGQGGGFLGREHDPMVVGDVTLGPSSLPNLAPPGAALAYAAARCSTRSTTTGAVGSTTRRCTRWTGSTAGPTNCSIRRALAPPSTWTPRPPSVRDRYGRHRSGQACLMARRLAEAEVPLITVFWNHSGRGQDKRPGQIDSYGGTRITTSSASTAHLLPRFDRSLSALLRDLESAGCSAQTLVVCMGEFGPPPASPSKRIRRRHPRPQALGRRVLDPPGRRRREAGAVIGASDRLGAYPKSDPVGPWDISATILAALGVDPATEYLDPLHGPSPPPSAGRSPGSIQAKARRGFHALGNGSVVRGRPPRRGDVGRDARAEVRASGGQPGDGPSRLSRRRSPGGRSSAAGPWAT